MRPVLMMAGGTGGHVFPALAVAAALRQQGIPVEWLATRKGMEQQLLASSDYRRHSIAVSGLRGHGLAAWLLAPIKLSSALWACIGILRGLKPKAAIGMGGFASGPGGLAARLLGVPLIIHEQNAIAGSTNRILARIAQVVLQAFPKTFGEQFHPITTGNPLRATIAATRSRAATRAASPGTGLRVLVLGGSQGARFLNEEVPHALAALKTRPLEILHQTGAQDEAATAARYRELRLAAQVCGFVSDMAAAYAWADLAICRAGALTVSELATTGLPALLIPFPHATDRHQHANARRLVDCGGARMLDQSRAGRASLERELEDLLGDPARLQHMSEQALGQSHAEATARVVQAIAKVYHGD